MARRGDGNYLRGKTWSLYFLHELVLSEDSLLDEELSQMGKRH